VSGPLLTQTSSRGWGRAIGDAQLAHIAGRELLRSRCPHHDPATQQEGAALPEVELGVLGGHKKHFGDVVSGWSSLPWLIDQATCQPYVTSRRPDQERLGANPGPCQQSPLSFNTRVTVPAARARQVLRRASGRTRGPGVRDCGREGPRSLSARRGRDRCRRSRTVEGGQRRGFVSWPRAEWRPCSRGRDDRRARRRHALRALAWCQSRIGQPALPDPNPSRRWNGPGPQEAEPLRKTGYATWPR